MNHSRTSRFATFALGAAGFLAAIPFLAARIPSSLASPKPLAREVLPRKHVDTNIAHGFHQPPVWTDATDLEEIIRSYDKLVEVNLALNENCLDCRGAGACIFPLVPTAVHQNPAGSRAAVEHFTEYLRQFPDDMEVRWLLNLAHMTLGGHPTQVPPEFLLEFGDFGTEDNIGRFDDVSHLVGLNRRNVSGGGVMDDFDNDGYLDLYIPRTGWVHLPKRPSLLRNNGDGTFTDTTRETGLIAPGNSASGTWADFDNSGYLDLFVCNEVGPNRLYRQRGDNTFEEIAAKAGVIFICWSPTGCSGIKRADALPT